VYRPASPNQSEETAKTLILIGLIFQAIEVAVVLAIGLVFIIAPIVSGIILFFGFIGVIWLVLVYGYSYRRTSEGDYEGARTPTLVFGILSLLTVNLISGILYVIAYSKLGDAERESTPLYPNWGAPPAPMGTKYCTGCGQVNALSSGFCAACGTRLV
jgi:hypothetical protein